MRKARPLKTKVTREDLDFAASVIKNGGLVAVPTETVYGLSADGFNSAAVEKIYEVKNRPETKPINLLVTGMDDVEKVCRDIPEAAYVLAEAFWPGPLTMILWKKDSVPDIVTAGGATVGVRAPANQLTLELIRRCGVPLATPSANYSGMDSAVNLQQVLEYFDGKIECVIDGGESKLKTASTILDMTKSVPKVLRLGSLLPDMIKDKTGIEVSL